MRRPRSFVLAVAVLFAASSLVLVFATRAYEEPIAPASGPGTVAISELAGADADGNGIRDDVDAFIEKNYSQDAGMRDAAVQIARSIQPGLALDLAQIGSTAALAEKEVQVMTCVIQTMGPARLGDVQAMIDRVSDKTYDNSLRFQKREAFRQRASGADLAKPVNCDPWPVHGAQL